MEPEGPAPTEQKATEERANEDSAQAWREVGQQFDALGKSVSEAFRLSWNNREARKYVMAGLEAMAAEVDRALSRTDELPAEARKLKDQVEKVAQVARAATEDAVRESRPRLLMTLRQVNGELQRLIERLEEREKTRDTQDDDLT
jgi:outer membrane murein-binding lipoprotein Lpp